MHHELVKCNMTMTTHLRVRGTKHFQDSFLDICFASHLMRRNTRLSGCVRGSESECLDV